MKQLTLPLGWPDDSKDSGPKPTLILSEYRRLVMALLDTQMGSQYGLATLFCSLPLQRSFSGSSWREPSYLYLGSPLQRIRRDGSLLFPTSHTIWDMRASLVVHFAEPFPVDDGTRRRLSFGSGASLVAKSYLDSSSGVKPKLHS